MTGSVRSLHPKSLKSVSGFLGRRFQANLEGRLTDPLLSEQFIRLHERKNEDVWFWLGEQVGKWLDASVHAGLIANNAALLERVCQIVDRLAKAQEADGYLGITTRHHRNPVRGMELYEMYYVLLGLEEVYRLLDYPAARSVACKLADYITRTWGAEAGQFPLVGRYPGNGHDGGEGTLILEPIVALGNLTGESRYVEWGEQVLMKWDAWWQSHPESVHAAGWTQMRRFAAGEIDLFDLRPNIHAHTYHMTLLGIAALYNATGKADYRQIVLSSIDRIAREWIFLTGGMSSGERYVDREYYHPRNDVEVCPQHTWLLLLDQAMRWTGEAAYSAEIERDLFNHFLAAQLADGSNWSYMTALNGQAQEPYGPNCCNAAGQRIAGRMPEFLYGWREDNPAVLIYSPSNAVFNLPGGRQVILRQDTEYPSQGQVLIHLDMQAPAQFALHLRIPPFAEKAHYQVNDSEDQQVEAGGFTIIERQWHPGDQVRLDLPMPVQVQANEHLAAIKRGPLVYCLFQDAQEKNGRLYWHRGIYPEDHCLLIDPDHPQESLSEEPAAPGLLGPALRLKGKVLPRAPIFATSVANAQVKPAEPETCLLLPFANQGSIRGEYRIFNRYQK
jgi:uncharacterized protein